MNIRRGSKRIWVIGGICCLLFSGRVSAAPGEVITASALAQTAEDVRIETIGQMCMEDYQKSGILASVSAAQCILESGNLTSELAVNANNCFGMKANLSGNTWEGSTWDGQSVYNKVTSEDTGNGMVNISADFRSYESLQMSIEDHSAYLLGAFNGSGLRYNGLVGQTDYRTAVQIIKDGGYATDSSYVDKVCEIIERYNLTRFDVLEVPEETEVEAEAEPDPEPDPVLTYNDKMFRIRKEWNNVKTQIGLYPTLRGAKRACKDGFRVFDSQGKELYAK